MADRKLADDRPPFGSGCFGRWITDAAGLPAYAYEIDERADPRARILELDGGIDAWHQIGNDRVIADAYNHGYVELWSQDRDYQWLNRFEADARQYAGGFGYLDVGGVIGCTLPMDRAAGAPVERVFGVGYASRSATCGGVDVAEVVHAPFGEATFLLHEVVLENRTSEAVDAIWWEYWGVNPLAKRFRLDATPAEIVGHRRALGPVRHLPELSALVTAQTPIEGDAEPLSIFAAVVEGHADGFESTVDGFFGEAGRERPAAVERGTATCALAGPTTGRGPSGTLFAFRCPVRLAAGARATLRFAYGYAHARDIAGAVREAASEAGRLQSSLGRWRDWLPRADLGPDHRWLERELAWAAYKVRSAAAYEEPAGGRVISEGGWYQFGMGLQLGFRDPLQHLLPLLQAAPRLAREVILYSAGQQAAADGSTPFAILSLGGAMPPTACDNDLWLLLAVAEYVFATRDLAILEESVPYRDGGEASLWRHLELAYRHQESFAGGPHGLYTAGESGDWTDLIVERAGLTESTLVTAQLAFVYPRFADLADLAGHSAFAAEVRARGEALRALVAQEWTGRGWLSRGYAGDRQLGAGTIYGEPQPWALMSGALDDSQANALVGNIRRFLTGVGAPPELNGPSRIGSSQSPAAHDPDVFEPGNGRFGALGQRDAVYIGGTWFAINGHLTWALAGLDGRVPRARELAWDELKRNTLAAHAEAFPTHWNGTLSVDDFCYSWYADTPQRCGWAPPILASGYYGHNVHQPTWLMFNLIRMAGLEATARGYDVWPRIPLPAYALDLPNAGLTVRPGRIEGHLSLAPACGPVELRVRRPQTWGAGVRVTVNGAPARHEATDGWVVFALPAAQADRRRWTVSAGSAQRDG